MSCTFLRAEGKQEWGGLGPRPEDLTPGRMNLAGTALLTHTVAATVRLMLRVHNHFPETVSPLPARALGDVG